MQNCGVPGCAEQSTNHQEKGFPDSQEYKKGVRDSWMAKINRILLAKELFISSDHFKPVCFKRDVKTKLDFSLKKYFCHSNENLLKWILHEKSISSRKL